MTPKTTYEMKKNIFIDYRIHFSESFFSFFSMTEDQKVTPMKDKLPNFRCQHIIFFSENKYLIIHTNVQIC